MPTMQPDDDSERLEGLLARLSQAATLLPLHGRMLNEGKRERRMSESNRGVCPPPPPVARQHHHPLADVCCSCLLWRHAGRDVEVLDSPDQFYKELLVGWIGMGGRVQASCEGSGAGVRGALSSGWWGGAQDGNNAPAQ